MHGPTPQLKLLAGLLGPALLLASACSHPSSASPAPSPTATIASQATPTATSAAAASTATVTATATTGATSSPASPSATPTPVSTFLLPSLIPVPSSSNAPALPPVIAGQGQVSTTLSASCSSTNGASAIKVTAGGLATGGAYIQRLRLFLDDVAIADSGDVSAQRLATISRTADSPLQAGAHRLRLAIDGSSGPVEKNGTVTVGGGSCSVRIG